MAPPVDGRWRRFGGALFVAVVNGFGFCSVFGVQLASSVFIRAGIAPVVARTYEDDAALISDGFHEVVGGVGLGHVRLGPCS
jgi:hypothetical protein